MVQVTRGLPLRTTGFLYQSIHKDRRLLFMAGWTKKKIGHDVGNSHAEGSHKTPSANSELNEYWILAKSVVVGN